MINIPNLIVKKSVKHTFSSDETAALNRDFRQAYANLKAVEADADAVKAQLKAKTTEAESRMETLNSTLQAGFEMREKDCVVIFRPGNRKKDYYLPEQIIEEAGIPFDGVEPLVTEAMTPDDFEQDLIRAESAFDNKVELWLWDAGADCCKLVVGRQAGKWFTALRGNVGQHKIEERLDGEQMATKKRFDALTRASRRLGEWLREKLGKEAAKGFEEGIVTVIEAERDKVE